MRKRTKLSTCLVVILSLVLMLCTVFAFTACTKKPTTSDSGSQTTSDGPQSSDGGGEEEPPAPGIIRIPVQGSVRYDFDVVAGYGKISGTKFNPETNEGVGVSSKEGIGSWITGFTWRNEASASLSIFSDKECEVDLGLKVRKTEEQAVLTSKVSVSIFDEVIDSEAEVEKATDTETIEFDEVNLGRFFISAGENVIKIVPMDSTDNFSFMSVIIYADNEEANLRWTDLKDVTGTIFYGINEKVTISGDFNKNYSENCIGVSGYAGATAKFPIYSSRQAKAKISFITCSMPVQNVFTDFYNFSINGTRQHSNARTRNGPLWGEYGVVYIGEYVLEKGLNEITIVSPAVSDYVQHYNFRALIVDTDATVGFDEVSEEEHVCLSKCATCGGCKTADCKETVCATKCTCQVYTFKGVDEKVVISAGLSKNIDGDFVDVTDLSNLQTVTFKINSTKAQKVNLGFVISKNPTASWTLTDYFRVWVNVPADKCNDTDGANLRLSKTEYTAPTVQGSGSEFVEVMLGAIDLKEGENTVTIGWTCVGSEAYKFTLRSMLIEAGVEVTLI